MEAIASFEELIQIMRSDLGEQRIAAQELAVAIEESERQIVRRDQVTRLRILRSGIMREVKDIERMESAAQSRANKRALFGGAPAAFIFGSIYTATTRHKDAYKTGVKLAGSVLSKNIPFGMVLIGIGKEGLPEDLKIIPVSRFARESNKTEPEVETSWKDDGYLLMTPEQFAELLDKVEQAVLDGSLCLPMAVDELILLIT